MLRKHVIDRDQDLVGDGNYGPLIPATCLETEKLVSQISAFGSGGRVGGLYQSALQIHMVTGDAAALALAGGIVVTGTNSRPRSQLRNASEHRHVHPQLSDDHRGQSPIHTGYRPIRPAAPHR